jgi:hypothetical protein
MEPIRTLPPKSLLLWSLMTTFELVANTQQATIQMIKWNLSTAFGTPASKQARLKLEESFV